MLNSQSNQFVNQQSLQYQQQGSQNMEEVVECEEEQIYSMKHKHNQMISPDKKSFQFDKSSNSQRESNIQYNQLLKQQNQKLKNSYNIQQIKYQPSQLFASSKQLSNFEIQQSQQPVSQQFQTPKMGEDENQNQGQQNKKQQKFQYINKDYTPLQNKKRTQKEFTPINNQRRYSKKGEREIMNLSSSGKKNYDEDGWSIYEEDLIQEQIDKEQRIKEQQNREPRFKYIQRFLPYYTRKKEQIQKQKELLKQQQQKLANSNTKNGVKKSISLIKSGRSSIIRKNKKYQENMLRSNKTQDSYGSNNNQGSKMLGDRSLTAPITSEHIKKQQKEQQTIVNVKSLLKKFIINEGKSKSIIITQEQFDSMYLPIEPHIQEAPSFKKHNKYK